LGPCTQCRGIDCALGQVWREEDVETHSVEVRKYFDNRILPRIGW